MAVLGLLLLVLSVAAGSYIRYPRDISRSSSGSGATSSASSSSYSSSGTHLAPGPGGYGSFNAFAGMSNFGGPPFYGGDFQQPNNGPPSYGFNSGSSNGFGIGSGSVSGSGSGSGSQPGQAQFPFTPFIPQYGQQYPFTPFPTFAAPFDFMSFLNQYFQSLQKFQAQAEAQAQQAAASGHGFYHKGPGFTSWGYNYPQTPFIPMKSGYPLDNNEVGGVAMATYSPQGGYGSANIFPKPEGALETRFGGDLETPQNSVGPVGSVSGNFKPPGSSSFGVFTSSSSGSSDINGKKTSFKQSSVGINDNGKITTYTAHDP